MSPRRVAMICGERGACPGFRRDPVAMDGPAPAHRGQKGAAVAGIRRPDENAGFDGSAQNIFSRGFQLRGSFQALRREREV